MICILQFVRLKSIPESLQIVLPFHLIVFVKVKKFRNALKEDILTYVISYLSPGNLLKHVT